MKDDKQKERGERSFDDSDEFWQISYMLPQKRSTAFSRDTDAVKIESDIPVQNGHPSADTGEKIDFGDIKRGADNVRIGRGDADISGANHRYSSKADDGISIKANVELDLSDCNFDDVLNAVKNVLPQKYRDGIETLGSAVRRASKAAADENAEQDNGREPDVIDSPMGGGSYESNLISDGYSAAIPPKTDGILFTYKPENPLIIRVDVRPWPSKYSFYNKFRADALRLLDADHGECCPVQFFSYMPQYSQLGPAHRSWYLWWRSNARRGIWLETEYSYILLYVYEIINLPDKILPPDGVKLLCAVWKAYREKYTKLDSFMTELVCDYCLANRLPAPLDILGEKIISSAQRISRFREFYTRCDAENPITDLLLTQSSGYDYHSSRFYTDETAALFDRHIRGALRAVLDAMDTAGSIRTQTVRYTRDIYNNALCVCGVKRCVDIEYLSLTRSQELKSLVTGAIRHAENYIRKLIKVSSKYKINNLSPVAASAVDEYFKPFVAELDAASEREREEKLAQKRAAAVPEYEKYYEALNSGLSEERARKLEAESWAVTDALTDAAAPEDNAQAVHADTQSVEVPDITSARSDADDDTVASPTGYPDSADYQENEKQYDDMLRTPERDDAATADKLALERRAAALLLEDNINGFNALAADNNMLADALADRLNAAAYDIIGDIAAENDGGWHIIKDYKEDMRAFADGAYS